MDSNKRRKLSDDKSVEDRSSNEPQVGASASAGVNEGNVAEARNQIASFAAVAYMPDNSTLLNNEIRRLQTEIALRQRTDVQLRLAQASAAAELLMPTGQAQMMNQNLSGRNNNLLQSLMPTHAAASLAGASGSLSRLPDLNRLNSARQMHRGFSHERPLPEASSAIFRLAAHNRSVASSFTSPARVAGLYPLASTAAATPGNLMLGPRLLEDSRGYTTGRVATANASATGPNSYGLPVATNITSARNNRDPVCVYMNSDEKSLSPYQTLMRKQLEFFAAKEEDVETSARGRNKPIVMGQVGIRCRHCAAIPPKKRTRGAMYYPAKLDGLYQAGQTIAKVHIGKHCPKIPEEVRKELLRLNEEKTVAQAGKQYWGDGARVLGVVEDNDCLRFRGN